MNQASFSELQLTKPLSNGYYQYFTFACALQQGKDSHESCTDS
jgi:hypothetical protein